MNSFDNISSGFNFVLLIGSILFSSSYNSAGGKLDSLVNNAIEVSLVHLEKSVAEVGDSTLFPTYGTKELKWKLDGAEQWTSGFYPGCLWYGYELSGDPRFEKWAHKWTEQLEHEKDNPETHDLGFKFMCTFGNGLRLGQKIDKNKYKETLLASAKTFADRYSPVVGCLSSNWDKIKIENSYPVIIDIMMNLELLFWASEHGGKTEWADYARNHAEKTYKDFVRPDNGTYHIVRYNKNTGDVINKGTLQGGGDETTWSRGHAWGAYGMVVVYRYTKEKQFLNYAMNMADYFIKNLSEDHVSVWDFNSEIKIPDVSATAIVASALFEMINYIEDESLKKHYQETAETMLTSLCKEPYFLGGKETSCLLDHSTHYLPINSNIDVPASFADYYFLETLLRYKALNSKM